MSDTVQNSIIIRKAPTNGKDGTNGKNGENGTSVFIEETLVLYVVTEDSLQPDDSEFVLDEIPDYIEPGRYLWSMTSVRYSDSTVTKTYSVSRIGEDGAQGERGEKGADGVDGAQGERGADGVDGTNGEDSERAWLKLSKNVLKKSAVEQVVNITVFYQKGTGEIVNINDYLTAGLVQSPIDPSVPSEASEDDSDETKPYENRYSLNIGYSTGLEGIGAKPKITIGSNSVITCTVSLLDSKTAQTVDTAVVQVVEDGKDGKDGKDGENGVTGDWTSYVFLQKDDKPDPPEGDEPIPDGWSDAPYGEGKWWMSKATISGETSLVIDGWSDPIQVTGEDGADGAYTDFKYQKNSSVTDTPEWAKNSVNPGSAWKDEPPSLSTNEYLWMIQADKNADGTLKTSWSTPVRISGEKGDTGEKGDKGEKGDSGIQGCIYRVTEWGVGYLYRNDTDLEVAESDDGLRYVDVVIRKDAKGDMIGAWMCALTHESDEETMPQEGAAWGEYWNELSNVNPIYTPFIMAENSVIKFMQGNQLLIMDSSQQVVAGMVAGDYPLWVGGETPNKAPFSVSADGQLHATNADIQGTIQSGTGDRKVIISPDNGQVSIYNDEGAESTILSGELFQNGIGELFPDSQSSIDLSGKNISRTVTETNTNGFEKVYGEVSTEKKQYTSRTEFVFSGTLSVDAVSVKSTTSNNSQLVSAVVKLVAYCYSDASFSNSSPVSSLTLVTVRSSADAGILIDGSESSSQSSTADFSKRFAIDSGYIVLRLEYSVVVSNANGESNVTYLLSNLKASTSVDQYVSRYFGNGFCLGQASDKYVAAYAQTKDSVAQMYFEAVNSNYGFKLASNGILQRIGNSSSSMWLHTPKLIMRAEVTYQSSGYVMSSVTWCGIDQGSVSSSETGKVKVTFPSGTKAIGGWSVSRMFMHCIAKGSPLFCTIGNYTTDYVEVWLYNASGALANGNFILDVWFAGVPG